MHYDVIIVGSGPSGTSTALHLAQRNPSLAQRTLVLERDRHPRHKLCGGALVPEVNLTLRRLGLDYRDVPHVDVDWAWVNYRGKGSRLRFNDDFAFPVVRRNEFDGWLADNVRQRGIEILEETRVIKLRRIDEGVEIETNRGKFTARVVVGADGVSGVVRRLVPEGSKPSPMARLLELVTPPNPPDAAATMPDDDAVLDFLYLDQGVQGYVWSFPTKLNGERARNWGVYDSRVLDRKSAGSLRPVMQDWMARGGFRLDDYSLEGHPIRLFEPKANFAAPHVLLVGDAAGVDPSFGEGIGCAIGYGEIAAQALDDAFRRGDFSFANYRQSLLESQLGRSLRKRVTGARWLNRLHFPSIQKLIWWRMGGLAGWFITEVLFKWGDRLVPETAPQLPAEPVGIPQPHVPPAHVGTKTQTRSR